VIETSLTGITAFSPLCRFATWLVCPLADSGENQPRQKANQPGGKQARRQISQRVKEPRGKKSRRQISQRVNQPGDKTTKGRKSQTPLTRPEYLDDFHLSKRIKVLQINQYCTTQNRIL